MMVRFDSKAGSGFSMFEKDARQMIRLLGHSDTIPGAILGADVGNRLRAFQSALATASEQEQAALAGKKSGEDEEKPVPVNRRAWPLLELLKAAAAKQENIMWDFDNSLF